jgi:hypothetical protein
VFTGFEYPTVLGRCQQAALTRVTRRHGQPGGGRSG